METLRLVGRTSEQLQHVGGLGGAAFAPVAKVPNVFTYFMIFLKFMGKIAGLFFGEEDNILNVTVFPPPIGGQPAAPRSFASIMHAQSSERDAGAATRWSESDAAERGARFEAWAVRHGWSVYLLLLSIHHDHRKGLLSRGHVAKSIPWSMTKTTVGPKKVKAT